MQTDIQPFDESLPKHIAIIMDGNGRWAKARHLPRSMGHRAGVERVRSTVKLCDRLGIKVLTLYAFSTENWNRPKEEVGVLMQLLIEYLNKEVKELHKQNVCLRHIGLREGLPKEVLKAFDDARELTKENTGLNLVIAINYGSRDEILYAARAMANKYIKSGVPMTKESLEEELNTAGLPEVDFVIRTSGEQRVSNFLLYQMAYAELYFTDVYWPDFDDGQMMIALRSFLQRERRFGGL